MLQAQIITHPLTFKFDAGTSRGVLRQKPTWFLKITHLEHGNVGVGECSLIPKLSIDPVAQVPQKLQEIADQINAGFRPDIAEYSEFPAIQFALESALKDVAHTALNTPFPGKFEQGKNIPINGLIWMGDMVNW